MARELPPTVQQVETEQASALNFDYSVDTGTQVERTLAPGLENRDIQFDERFGPSNAAPPPGTPQNESFLVDPVAINRDVDITVKPFREEGRLFSSYSPEEQAEVRKVANQLGVSPEAIAGVSRIETGEGFRNLHSRGSQYHGLFQMNVGEGYVPGMSRVEQVKAYGQMAKDKDYLGKLQAEGIDISKLPVSKQAAILQGFQFAPNAKAWLRSFDTQTTDTLQSRELKYGKSVNQMARVFDELMGGAQGGQVWAFGSGVTKRVDQFSNTAALPPYNVDHDSPEHAAQDVQALNRSIEETTARQILARALNERADVQGGFEPGMGQVMREAIPAVRMRADISKLGDKPSTNIELRGGPYDTTLKGKQIQGYQDWAKASGKDPVLEEKDYDLRGFFLEHPEPMRPGEHGIDKFKKPSHPTFSDESKYSGQGTAKGGHWVQKGKEWYFHPGPTNMRNFTRQQLQEYFDTQETSDTHLAWPDGKKR